ncbi:hypothetical protein [Bacillus sp. FJAT-47783]|uniref:hypothetical protein n=1 Tax=Bacillus sp. FJAT-47783 TaxID=2922712 RepID=UPI001FAD6E3C|nr:hypothetical protein [Bacillus sp. FJAT-47783]
MKPPLTTEDKDTAADYIILKLLKTTLEKDIDSVKQSSIRLQKPLIEQYERIINQINQDIRTTRKSMQKSGIKVYDREIINEDIWRYKFVVRGYQDEFRFWKALRLHMQKRLKQYMN